MKLPRPHQIGNRIIFRCDHQIPAVHLTFDDGPSGVTTLSLVDLLAELKVPATFFITGSRAQEHPQIIQHIHAAGHSLGNHGFWHQSFLFRSSSVIRESILQTNLILEKITHQKIKLFRPPFGQFGLNTYRVCRELGLKIILWDLWTGDYWPNVSVASLVKRATQSLQPGSIILLHDIQSQSPKLLQALPEIVQVARSRNFQFRGL